MRPSTVNTLARARWSARSSPSSIQGSAYRRISTSPLTSRSSGTSQTSFASQTSTGSPLTFLRSEFLPQDVLFKTTSAYARQFSTRSALSQQAQKQPDPEVKEKATSSEGAKEETPGEEGKEKKAGEEKAEGEEEGEKKEQKKDDKPPPPPHGDKTPWQVFTETLKTEFQASKEWNEGTKQLSAGVNDFTQDPRVQKAKSTYTKVTGAASTHTAEALKTTGRAIGQGAAWTWDTTPVKGVRKVANVTGTGLEYVTRPVRQSKAFQAVKETVDDGSSSRYGGWIEKEERRKRRELRELNELQRSGRTKADGPIEEDPE